jgi:hypothetical protein
MPKLPGDQSKTTPTNLSGGIKKKVQGTIKGKLGGKGVYRIAGTGRYVTVKYGNKNPTTTVKEPKITNPGLVSRLLTNAINRDKQAQTTPITVRIYLDTDDAFTALKVVQGVTDVLEEAGYGKFKIDNVDQGSIKLRIRAWLDSDTGQKAQRVGKEKLSETAGYMEQYAKDATVNKQRAEISAINSQTARNLIDGLENVNNGAMQMDEWLVVKTTDAQGVSSVAVRKLSITEMVIVNRSPGILTDPKTVFEKLTLLTYEEDASILAIDR